MKTSWKGVVEDVDRHGNVRVYYRASGKPKVRLREMPGTAEFMREYQCAVWGVPYTAESAPPPPAVKTASAAVGTFRWLCEAHFAEGPRNVSAKTFSDRRKVLESLLDEHGDKVAAEMERRHVVKIRDQRLDVGPFAAHAAVKAISSLYRWGIDAGHVITNPATGISRPSSGDGFHTWSIEEIEQFESVHPAGSTACLALHVFLFTGLRLSDAAILGRQHIRDVRGENGAMEKWVVIRPGKTEGSSRVLVEIPVLPELAVALASAPKDGLTFITNEYGKPFSVKGLGNRMRKWCDAADLKNCSAHGLRKAGAAIAAENGATHEQLKSIYGWTTFQQADHYIRAARRRRVAGAAKQLLRFEKTAG